MPWSYDGSAHPVRARDPVASQNLVASQARPGEGPSTRMTWGPRPVASLWHEDLWRHLAPVRCRKAASRSLSSIGVNATELQVYPARHGTLSHDVASLAHLQRQTSGGATRAESVFAQSPFFRPGKRWPPRARRRRALAVESLAPPDAARIAARVATGGSAHGATVYTNAPKRRREAILANLCTLLRPPRPLARPGGATGPTTPTAPWPRDARALGPEVHAAGAVTQPATNTNS